MSQATFRGYRLRLLDLWQRAKLRLLGPSAGQIEEAKKALAGREYYQLYDDVYRKLREVGGSDDRERKLAEARALVQADFGLVRSRGLVPAPPATMLDIGCGEGYNAVWWAGMGYSVTGVDISPTVVEQAREYARGQNSPAQFRVANALELADDADGSVDMAADCGCLHMLVKTEHRQQYLAAVRRVLRPGGVFFLFQRASAADVTVADEDEEILKSVAGVQKRFADKDGKVIEMRGCGFRNASLNQYRQELTAAGFTIAADYRDDDKHRDFAMILAKK